MQTKHAKFKGVVYDHYHSHKRDFPWRKTSDPYKILVSEIMLQQTQTDRVVPKYKNFTQHFPNVETLASSETGNVLRQWQGLGYNRRAIMLHKASQEIVRTYNGTIPKTQKELESLPGIGPYTAAAIMAFAFNKPVIMLETNIRSVFIHHFFNNQGDVDDKEIMPIVEQTLDTSNPREWYSALMDYGTYLKKLHPNPNRKSRHYTKQSKFEGSDRQIRGEIIRIVIQEGLTKRLLIKKLETSFKTPKERTEKIIKNLIEERMVTEKSGKIITPS